MGRKSTVKTLPDEVRAAIDALLADGVATLDDLVEYCAQAGHAVSRSAMGRYKQNFDQVAAKIRESREMAKALVTEVGPDLVEGKTGRMLVEMLQTITFDYLMRQAEGEEGADPEMIFMLARGLKDMASAQKIDTDRELKLRQATAKKAADKVDKLAAKAGISKKTRDDWRREVLGIGNE